MTKKNNNISVESAISECQTKVTFVVKNSDSSNKIYFSANQKLTCSSEASAVITLIEAMSNGINTVRIDGPLDTTFVENQETVQNIYNLWLNNQNRVEFIPDHDSALPVKINHNKSLEKKRVGAFFSGGADSFYTFIKHKKEITDLVFIHGFDIALSDTQLREQTASQLRLVAKENGINLIEVETNVRDYIIPQGNWGSITHGIALISVGHLLAGILEKMYIPSSYNYANLFPWGTHPLLDPFWSSSHLTFIHDGCEARRVDKIALIAKDPLALKTLRVCWKNPDSAYNCCKCEKCVRTMINLEVFDALKGSPVFPEPLTVEKIKNVFPKGHSAKEFIRENIEALKQKGGREDFIQALEYLLVKKPWKPPLKNRVKRRVRTLLGRD